MSTTTTVTTTTIAPEAKTIAALDLPFRLRGVEQELAMLGHAADPLDSALCSPRRFAPQLVETSRRTCRDGDAGLRAADKTDATPYARHGYSGLRSRMRRHRARSGRITARGAVRDIRDEEAKARVHDAALDVFPNSRPRQGGAAHYFFLSDDDTASESRLSFGALGGEPRRRSTDMSWWHPVTQRNAEAEEGPADVPVVEVRDVESEPECGAPRWTLADRKRRVTERPAHVSTASDAPLVAPKPRAPFKEKPAAITTAAEKAADPEFEVMRRAASPPLLGADLVFPRCASPESCRLTTDLPFSQRASEEKRRDPTQKCGLWGGYCFQREAPSVVDANKLTPPGNSGLWPGRGGEGVRADAPSPPPTPRGMWAAPVGATPPSQGLSPFQGGVAERPRSPPSQGLSPSQDVRMEVEKPTPQPSKALSPFQNVHVEIERPSPPPAKPALDPEEKERRIEAEFTDAFVTQLYSYLSLGYPVTARAFDEELCAASGVAVEELRGRDEEVMRRGHVCDGEVGRWAVGRCPRWRALREYVRRWAREQEDLDVRKGCGLGVGVWGGRGSWMP